LAISRDQFIDCLGKSGLLSVPEAAALAGAIPAGDATAFATELVKQKKLTAYQASILSQGQFKGLVFGDYKVLDKLGEGGMGLVFKAQHRVLKRIVALKVLHPAVTQSEEAIRRFHREVEAVARLTHPNIITAYDASVQDGIYYLAMEFVDGIDLGRVVKEQGTLPVSKAVDYLIQAGHGLAYTHKMGVVHRDIKPSNLLLDAEGHVRILDMGLVRFTDAPTAEGATRAGNDGLTQTGDIMGSFDYIAPEQAIDTKRADARADVYSLGCTLYFLLTGKPPYAGDTSMQKLLSHRETAIPSLRKARPETPLALDAVFHRMVAKKAEDRYPSMSEVLADLEGCRERPAESAERVGAPRTLPAGRSVPGLAMVLCGTLCILAVVGANAYLAREAMSQRWTLPPEVLLVAQWALWAGVGIAAVGVILSLGSALLGRPLRAAQRADGPSWGRRLLGGLLGLLLGGLAGAVIGSSLARSPEPQVRLASGVVVGAFVGAALGGRRNLLIVIGGAIAGWFVGSEVGTRGLALTSLGYPLEWPAETTAILGFAALGALVGAALGAERRLPAAARAPVDAAATLADSHSRPGVDDGAGKTVRRLSSRP